MSFGQKVTSWFDSRWKFRAVISKVAAKKEETLLDEDPLWWVLEYVLFDHEEFSSIEPISTRALFQFLSQEAEDMKLREFQHWYKSPAALGKRLANIKDELAKRIEVEEIPSRARMKLWGFRRKAEAEELKPEQAAGPDWAGLAKATAREDLLPPEEPKPEDELAIMEEFGWTEENLAEVEQHSKKDGEENEAMKKETK